jgi:hypothetical protein
MEAMGVKSFPVIRPGSAQFDAWRQYFELHLRWTPVVMRKLIDNAPDKPKDGMTVPTEYPDFFDRSFVEDKAWRPSVPKQLRRLSHETIEELHARFGPNWGLKIVAQQQQKKREYKPFTDDELRNLYRKAVSRETP